MRPRRRRRTMLRRTTARFARFWDSSTPSFGGDYLRGHPSTRIPFLLGELGMAHVIPLWDIPSLAVRDSRDRYPVRRIFCVGRNYVEHQKEMGGDGREQPFFFLKAAHTLVPRGGDVHYPLKTSNYHYETEMVVAIAKGGRRIDAKKASEHIFGYAVGFDMTRRDLQQVGKDTGRPWDFGKDFDEGAPCGVLALSAT